MNAQPPPTSLVYRGAIIAALGGLLFGFDTAVISGAEKALQTLFALNNFWQGFTVATALIGTVFGSILIEDPADRWGRRNALFLLATLYFISALGCAFAPSWLFFCVSRFVGGLAIGGASVVAPMYIAEISPAHLRGRLVAVNQLNVVIGVLLSFTSNYLVARYVGGTEAWRWMLGIVAIPSALFFALLFGIAESPRWLVMVGRFGEAENVLRRLGHDDPQTKVSEIAASVAGDGAQDRLFQMRYLKPIFFAWAIAMFNQLSGINVVVYYAPRIFEMAGSGESSALLQTIGLGVVNLVATIAGLSMIDYVGRRKLIIWGSYGYIASLATIAWCFHAFGNHFSAAGGIVMLVALIIYQAAHCFSQGAVIWVFISEIFPNAVRAKGQALGSATHWTMAALISLTFPMVAAWSGAGAFAFFAVMMIVQLVFALKLMPETRGRRLEDEQLAPVSVV